jgi:hypothetical protein
MLGGRKPATRMTVAAQSNAYSIMSCPLSSRHSFLSFRTILCPSPQGDSCFNSIMLLARDNSKEGLNVSGLGNPLRQ